MKLTAFHLGWVFVRMGIFYQGNFSNSHDQVYRLATFFLLLNIFSSVEQADGPCTPKGQSSILRLVLFSSSLPFTVWFLWDLPSSPRSCSFFLRPFMAELSVLVLFASPPALSPWNITSFASTLVVLRERDPGGQIQGLFSHFRIVWNPSNVPIDSHHLEIFLPLWHNTLLAFQ